MTTGMTAKAVLVGLGVAAGTLFGGMAPAQADELGGTGIVGSYTTPVVETRTVSDGATAFDGIYAVEKRTVGDTGDPDLIVGNVGYVDISVTKATWLVGSYTLDELVHLTLASGGKHYPDATLITRSDTLDTSALVGS